MRKEKNTTYYISQLEEMLKYFFENNLEMCQKNKALINRWLELVYL